MPIHFLRPRCKAAKDVNAIADEILRRVPVARSLPPEFLHFENRVGLGESRKVAS